MGAEDQLFKQLRKLRGSQTLIIGIGQLLKGDDGAGPLVCQRLQSAKVSAEIIDAGTVPENYIQPVIKKLLRIFLLSMPLTFQLLPER